MFARPGRHKISIRHWRHATKKTVTVYLMSGSVDCEWDQLHLHSVNGFGKLAEECVACKQRQRWFQRLLCSMLFFICIKVFLLAGYQFRRESSVTKLSIINVSIIHCMRRRRGPVRRAYRATRANVTPLGHVLHACSWLIDNLWQFPWAAALRRKSPVEFIISCPWLLQLT